MFKRSAHCLQSDSRAGRRVHASYGMWLGATRGTRNCFDQANDALTCCATWCARPMIVSIGFTPQEVGIRLASAT